MISDYNKLIYEGAIRIYAGWLGHHSAPDNMPTEQPESVVKVAKYIAKLSGIEEPTEHVGMSQATIGSPTPVCHCSFPSTCTGRHI